MCLFQDMAFGNFATAQASQSVLGVLVRADCPFDRTWSHLGGCLLGIIVIVLTGCPFGWHHCLAGILNCINGERAEQSMHSQLSAP